ncbi:hypothetical protein MFLAVUS_001051 [Mucor flavus]|uniref:Peptidase A2 domain-containing protein n=1 Tax=Mucor flavus TaxID=439312 RepID=A0ABP9YLF2_9FUNG
MNVSLSDVESVYRYPYDLQKMKSGSPLRGAISINGKTIEAVFDTGASVSILGSKICSDLGLVPNGDRLHLVGFNQDKEKPTASSVVMDVPINIGGKIRPEHMAVQTDGGSDICLLGIPWFQAYGISLDLQRSQIKVPTCDGMIKIQGRTSQVRRSQDEQEVYLVSASQKFCSSLEDDLIPAGEEGDLGFDNPIQEIVFTGSLPETDEFSVESAPVIYYNFHPYKFCEDLVLEELVLAKRFFFFPVHPNEKYNKSSILVKDIKEYNQFDTK